MIQTQTDKRYLERRAPEFVLMDSFSELTDQEFVYHQGHFFTHFSDLKPESRDQLEMRGLFDLTNLREFYNMFQTSLNDHFGKEIPIFFVNFPDKFENRPIFKERAEVIRRTSFELSECNNNWHNIQVPEKFVYKKGLDDYPYHFSMETSSYVASLINSKLLRTSIQIKSISWEFNNRIFDRKPFKPRNF
jgi:hypothetical protein